MKGIGMDNRRKWDLRFLLLAEMVGGWSHDRTKVGAVIIDNDKRIVSVGYNGFPKNIDDTQERYDDRTLKLQFILHAENNAILFSQRNLSGMTLFTFPFICCSNCAALVIQSGIKRVVSPKLPENLMERWKENTDLSKSLFDEAKVEWLELDWVEIEKFKKEN